MYLACPLPIPSQSVNRRLVTLFSLLRMKERRNERWTTMLHTRRDNLWLAANNSQVN